MKDKDREWRVVSADSPVSMKFASQYAESLSNTKAQMDRVSYLFRKGEGLSNTDNKTFSAGYKLAYEIAHLAFLDPSIPINEEYIEVIRKRLTRVQKRLFPPL